MAEHQKIATMRAFNIYYWMKNNQQCLDLQIVPNLHTFSNLMRCVIATVTLIQDKSNNNNISESVNTIIQEMDVRWKNGEDAFKPHVGIYSGAIKALLSVRDFHRAEELLKILEESTSQQDDCNDNNTRTSYPSSITATSPDTSDTTILEFSTLTYMPFYKYFIRMRSADGAQRAEKMHNHMRQLYHKRKDTKLKPNIMTYNAVLEAWVASRNVFYVSYLWKVYEQMKLDKIPIEYETYKILIQALSSSKGKANRLRFMELIKQYHTNQVGPNNGNIYLMATKNLIARGGQTVHLNAASVAEVIKLFIDSYVHGRFVSNIDVPDRPTFNWIISTYIAGNDLESAIFFLEDLLQLADQSKYVTDGKPLDVSWIGPDLDVLLELRKAWANTPSVQKDYYVKKMDDVLIPAMVRLLNIAEGNVRNDQTLRPKMQQQQGQQRQ
jgi:hypothetical protein